MYPDHYFSFVWVSGKVGCPHKRKVVVWLNETTGRHGKYTKNSIMQFLHMVGVFVITPLMLVQFLSNYKRFAQR